MAIKRIQLRGISHSPSDNMSSDGGCDESVNFTMSQEELAPMDVLHDVGSDIYPEQADRHFEPVFIHKTSSYSNTVFAIHTLVIISEQQMTPGLYTISDDGSEADDYNCFLEFDTDEAIVKIEAIGNTLIVLTNQRMEYVLFNDNEYKDIGSNFPEPKIAVRRVQYNGTKITGRVGSYWRDYREDEWTGEIREAAERLLGVAGSEWGWSSKNTVSDFDIKQLSKSIQLNVQDIINLIKEKGDEYYNDWINSEGQLIRPIFVRYAFKMFDGTEYIMQSAPVLIDPDGFLQDHTEETMFYEVKMLGGSGTPVSYRVSFDIKDNFSGATKTVYYPYHLMFEIANTEAELNSWKDIIQSVEIAVSPALDKFVYEFKESSDIQRSVPGSYDEPFTGHSVFKLKRYTDNERDEWLSSNSQFYVVKSILFEDYIRMIHEHTGSGNPTFGIDDYHIFNDGTLATKKMMSDDVGNSMRKLHPSNILTFNSRLIMSGVSIEYPEPYFQVASNIYNNSSTNTYYIKFICSSSSGKTVTNIREYSGTGMRPGPWLFYPDVRCHSAEVYRHAQNGQWFVTKVAMKEDEYLNGAYYFAGWVPTDVESGEWIWDGEEIDDPTPFIVDKYVDDFNTLYQSASSNPFVVESRKDFPDSIVGVSLITAPLSQGQFGYADLYVFTKEGIYTISAAADGSFGQYKYLSSSVALDGTICQLEQAIAFVSERGLMLLVGSQIRCLSDKMLDRSFNIAQLDGFGALLEADSTYRCMKNAATDTMPFFEFIRDCTIIHDVAGNRLLMMKKFASDGIMGYCYVYDFASDSFHKCLTPYDSNGQYNFSRSLNSYPDAIAIFVKTGTFVAVSCNRSNSSGRGTAASYQVNPCLLVTRSINFDETYARKRINRIRIRGTWDTAQPVYSSVQYVLYGSMNGNTWVRLTSLHGASYKFYRIAVLALLKPWDRISWIDVDYTATFGGSVMR